MRGIELEEGEAFFVEDDDENIDPDRDFSYIDRKIENVLGHYQKDFMGGLSAESLGARYGGYGSFLPMQQRCPPVLSNQRTQSNANSKSPHNLPPENSTNISVPARRVTVSSDQSVQTVSDLGISSMNNQSKCQNSGERAYNHQQKKPTINHAEQNSLKFRVKLASESVLSRDNSAIYSGLGLDMSPSSSPEGSPLENDGPSPGMQDTSVESPSFIIKIMTSVPLLNDALLSPLHDDLVYLMGVENDLETGLPAIGHEDISLEGNKEASKERKPKLKNASKVKKAIKERKPKQKMQRQMPMELVENHEFPGNVVNLSASIKEERGTSVAKEILSNISINDVDVPFNGNSKSTGSRPSVVVDKRSEVVCTGEANDNSMKQVQVARHKAKEELGSASCDAAVEEEGYVNKLRGKTEKDKNAILITKSESSTDRRNEFGRREDEANKFVKHQIFVKDLVKEELLNSVFPKEHRKENGAQEEIRKDKEVDFVSLKDIGESDKDYGISEEMKYHDGTLESSNQKSHLKPMSHLSMGQGPPGVKEHSSSVIRKKVKVSDGISAAEPFKGSLMVTSSAPENEDVTRRSNIPSKIRTDTDLHSETGKVSEVAENPSKIGKPVSSKDFVMGVSERETQLSTRKVKEQSSSKKTGFTGSIGPNMETNLAGSNRMMEKVPVGELPPPPENASLAPLDIDSWVQCEKCQKWRLLPFGWNPDDLPKEWVCRMLTWLAGMNKCSVSEDETTNALRALYQPPALDPAAQVQNNQQTCLDGSAFVNTSAGAQHVALLSRPTGDLLPSGGKKKNVVKLEMDAAGQSGFRDNHRSVKKDKQHYGGSRNPKNLKKNLLQSYPARKNGDDRPLKIEKKRLAGFEVSGVPKKMKRAHQRSLENPDLVRLLPVEGKGETQNYDPGALRIPQDFVEGSSYYPPVKLKDTAQSATGKDEMKDVSGKKRKLKDQWQSVTSVEPSSGKGLQPLNNLVAGENSGTGGIEHRKQKKSNASNSQTRESSADKGRRPQIDGCKHNLGRVGNSIHKGGRTDGHADWISQKSADMRKSSVKALDIGLSENATTSSSSKVSSKVKAKARELKCSPIGSISSSPLKACKSDPENMTSKIPIPYNEPEEMSSRKRLKSRAQGASIEFPPHDEDLRDRKSNLSRTSGAVDVDHFTKKLTSGRHPSAHRVDAQSKHEDYEDVGDKLDRRYHEGTMTSQKNLENQVPKSLNRLHFDGTNSEREKRFEMVSEKESSSYSHGVPEFEKGSGSNSLRVGHDNGRVPRKVTDDHLNLRHPLPTGHVSKDIDASSSRKKDSFHRAASTALKEAKDLKHSADRLKTSGSGLESTVIFFQAALKFLHGASLLEPGNNESGRVVEMTSTEVYSTTAKLCKYCAHEFEKCNDMALAALAYKCMEVAYMRVVYYNDVTASRDRLELQTAVRAAPQVDSPSSSASDIDNLNNQATVDIVRDGHSAVDHRNHVISAGNRPNFVRLLSFTHDINLAMEASRRSQSAFAAANPVLLRAGNEEGISSIKGVLDFSFHDVDGLLHLVRLAMEALNN